MYLLSSPFFMVTLEDGKKAVQLARHTITSFIDSTKATPSISSLSELFQDKRGVFVTLHTFPNHELRGCIGIPYPVMKLHDALIEAARSVTHDPRFPPLQTAELDQVLIEVTVLTPPEEITVTKPDEYLLQIHIGRDGLIVEQRFFKGLLLPQVPVEQNWDVEAFLAHTCMKAGLPPDAWIDTQTKFYKFSGQIFTEVKPHGTIEEKHIDGSDN